MPGAKVIRQSVCNDSRCGAHTMQHQSILKYDACSNYPSISHEYEAFHTNGTLCHFVLVPQQPGAYPAQQSPYGAQTPASSSLPYGQQQQAYPAAQTAATGRAGAYPQQALTPQQQQTYSAPTASQTAATANPYSNNAAYGFTGEIGCTL